MTAVHFIHISSLCSNLLRKMAKEANWDGKGLLCDHMAEVERNAGPITLECLAYRALRWKYNIEIPNYLNFLKKEPLGYPLDYKAITIEKIYDQAIEVGLKTSDRVFVKHGLWCALSKFKKLEKKSFKQLMGASKRHPARRPFVFKSFKFCFICYLKDKLRYRHIENDLPHDRYITSSCVELHFVKLVNECKHFVPDVTDDVNSKKMDRYRRMYVYVAHYLQYDPKRARKYFVHVSNLFVYTNIEEVKRLYICLKK